MVFTLILELLLGLFVHHFWVCTLVTFAFYGFLSEFVFVQYKLQLSFAPDNGSPQGQTRRQETMNNSGDLILGADVFHRKERLTIFDMPTPMPITRALTPKSLFPPNMLHFSLPTQIVPGYVSLLCCLKPLTEFSPLTEFQPFPRLPIELRLKIWKLASLQPRIIAIKFAADAVKPPMDFSLVRKSYSFYSDEEFARIKLALEREPVHQIVRVCPKSRVPAMMHTNHEARVEAQRIYELRKLSIVGDQFFYSPQVDIIYIGGDNYCCRAIGKAFYSMYPTSSKLSSAFPRVAIDLSSSIAPCCAGNNFQSRAHTLMVDLHGTIIGQAGGERFRVRGCEGLKEVFFVVKSLPWHRQPQDVEPSSVFRPAAIDGATKTSVSDKAQLQGIIERVKNDQCISRIDEMWGNHWLGKNKPTFSFVSFASLTGNSTVFETLAVSTNTLSLMRQNADSLEQLAEVTNCYIRMPKAHLETTGHTGKTAADELCAEISVTGPKPGVDHCMAVLAEVIKRW